MTHRCVECGAEVPENGTCREHLDALIALEWQIPDGPGELPHFYAIATYGLQHPRAMNYTRDTVSGLRSAVADALAGRASMAELRRRARSGASDRGRVTRREGDAESGWSVAEWPMTIVDVVPFMTNRERYATRVREWAQSVIGVLGERHPLE
jgi:hypothetical protein